MSATYLDEIMAFHRERASKDDRRWQDRLPLAAPERSLRLSLFEHRSAGVAVIAEVKRRSPSKGWLAENLDAVATATAYESGGASGISVLTDEPHFGGSLNDLRLVAAAVALPVLRKDFTVAPNDVLDAVEAGAAAILLIAAALTTSELTELFDVARQLAIDVLLEVHTVDEARAAVDLGAELIGVNQRDLRTFSVDQRRAELVVASLPANVVAVAESGFLGTAAVARAAAAGFDAVLVGESFVTAPSPRDAVHQFVGAPIGERRS
jgi:indole-3-glycerol phosphate synthase